MTTPGSNSESSHRSSIMHRITDGTLRINSVEEFEEMLAIYPNDPLLYRKYADLLSDKGHLKKCLKAYDHAVQLFIENGMNLQAIVAKILRWSIVKPSHEEGRQFHELLHDEGARHTPLQRFWSQMSYSELVSVMLRLVRIRMPAGQKVIHHGDPADTVFFVVSGSLMETHSAECERKAARQSFETEPLLLRDNDILGDIFPLDEDVVSTSEIRTLTEVELVKIKKTVLVDTCRRHPNIEMLLRSMLKTDTRDECDRQWQTVRRSKRFGVPTKVEVLFGTADQAYARIRKTGIALDLSLNGICIDLGTDHSDIDENRLKGQFVQLRLDLPNDVAILDISGKIVWQQRQTTQKGSTVLIGIRFDAMDKTDRDLLIEYCTGSAGEQNLLWSLWHTMVNTDNPED